MKYLSVCSGIEAASVAWNPLGWTPLAFSEIEKFPSRVLAARWPDVPNYGDMTRFQEWPDVRPDILVGGTPCQSFSIAGLRAGLADPRGNLMLTYLAIADRFRPAWIVWENVPGVLSVDGGRPFGTFVRGLAELGYHASWRVLDAQHVRTCGFERAVPQRRRRVFVVGYLGDWRRAAAVLFERESLRWNPPPRREAGEGVAISVVKGAAIGREPENGPQFREVLSDGSVYTLNCTERHAVVAPALTGSGRGTARTGETRGQDCLIADEIARCDTAGAAQRYDWETENFVTGFSHFASSPGGGDVSPSLRVGGTGGNGGSAMQTGTTVRRLTPLECERLQGFPDFYTVIDGAADGPRYKALGNSMAVNVMRHIGRRINAVTER